MTVRHKNIVDKLSYKLWKHLNKQYGTNFVPDFARNTQNDIRALPNELNQINAQNKALFVELNNASSFEAVSLRRLSVINYNSGKAPLNVLFLCPDKDVFCLEKLFHLMEKSVEFQPVVGVFPYEHVDPKIKFDASKYEKIVQWLEQKRMKYVPLYDFEKNEYLSLKKVQPDIVFSIRRSV